MKSRWRQHFLQQHNRKKMNQANVTNLVSKLKFNILPRHRNLRGVEGPAGRIRKIQKSLTALIKYERLEMYYNRADETRGYVDRVSKK